MGVSARYAVRVAGLAVALGLTAMTGQAIASADDGTGSPTPGGSSADEISVGDDATVPPPTFDSAATQLAAEQIRDIEHLVEMAQNDEEYTDQMFDYIADMKSRLASVPAPERTTARAVG